MAAVIAAEICGACGHISLEERGFCNRCGSRDIVLGSIAGSGTLWSQSLVHRQPSTEGGQAEPYAIGIVTLDAGPRIMTTILQGLRIGDALCVERPTLDGVPVARKGQ